MVFTTYNFLGLQVANNVKNNFIWKEQEWQYTWATTNDFFDLLHLYFVIVHFH